MEIPNKPIDYTTSSVIYVTGSPRSGSTLLDLLLGNHMQVTGVGEFFKLSFDSDTRLCSCGSIIDNCPFWIRVNKLVCESLGLVKLINWKDYPVGVVNKKEILRNFPNLLEIVLILGNKYLFALLTNLSSVLRNHLETANNSYKVYDAIATLEGSRYVLDSSKNLVRLKLLYLIRPVNFKIIRIVRDGRAHAAAGKRYANRSISFTARAWKRQQQYISIMLKSIPSERKYLIKYEDLCETPEDEISKLCNFLEIDYSNEILNLDSRVYHNIPGNPMLFNLNRKIVEDKRWKSELSEKELREFECIAGHYNRTFGYD